jgi:hypothetical protein
MAYMNQEKKNRIAEAVKPILKKYGVKGTLSVRNHSTIVLTMSQGRVDFIGDMNADRLNPSIDTEELRERYNLDINPYWYQEHYGGETYHFLSELIPAIKSGGWYNNSDISTDYFDTAYYFDINVGTWKKPYTLTN